MDILKLIDWNDFFVGMFAAIIGAGAVTWSRGGWIAVLGGTLGFILMPLFL